MVIRSLAQMAEAVAVRYIDEVCDLGGIPFWAAKGILERIRIPDQLRTIEENDPILREDTSYLWHRFIERDFRQSAAKKQLNVVDPCETWTLYYRYQQEEEDEIAHGLAKLKQDLKTANQKESTALMPARLAPRAGKTGYRPWGGCDRHSFGSKYAGKTKGQIGLAKVMQKAKDFKQANRLTARSIYFPPTRLGQAPKGMARSHEIANLPDSVPVLRPPPRIQPTTNPDQLSREERLRRAKEGKAPEPTPEEVKSTTKTTQASPPPPTCTRPAAVKRNSGLLNFSPGANANCKVTRVLAKSATSPPPPSERDRMLSRVHVQPRFNGKPRHASPPLPAQNLVPLEASPPQATAREQQSPPARGKTQREAALAAFRPPPGRKRPADATPSFLRPMKRSRPLP
ncbi:RNA polymerase II transcription factor SIII (Elongin) subunit A [Zalerion maritima]|uniref:RNA polymerase II transcription factor SIII (Elongin) subunit A n=1 Tax=Zalerion maritima TaxID=339359 RepID=A0AAD5WQD2_9PEZI|nr:RNA polymerase II transcription factor SIII (Elongin) subunit A [Zalerion maritima]